jgi:molybdopterin-guanine dinucleotide biosynthesis protein A
MRSWDPVGVVLAGGDGRRMGGAKATVKLAGRPLLAYPLDAVWRAVGHVAIVAKRDSPLPEVPGVTVWIEPDRPRHPLAGIVHALGLASGRPVVVCAGDLPLVSEDLLRRVARPPADGSPATVAAGPDGLQPLVGCYGPAALAPLATALAQPDVPLREAVARLELATVEVTDPEELFNVNRPEDLLQVTAILDRRQAPDQPNVKS